MSAVLFSPSLPWTVDPLERRRYRLILLLVFAAFLSSSLTVTFVVPPPKMDRAELEEVPPRLARLLIERKPPPPPPPQPKVEEVKPEPKPEEPPKPEVEEKPKPKPEEVQEAREKASKSGLLAMRDELAALRELAPSAVFKQLTPGEEGKSRTVQRDLISKRAEQGSGGVASNQVAARRGERLAGGATSVVEAPVGVPGGGQTEERRDTRQRTSEEIQLAFDRSKSAIYAIYRRALRTNLTLQGRVVLELEIAPNGAVTACRIVSSELNDNDLERKLVARVQLIDFGKRDVLPWKGTYHIDFLPTS